MIIHYFYFKIQNIVHAILHTVYKYKRKIWKGEKLKYILREGFHILPSEKIKIINGFIMLPEHVPEVVVWRYIT